MKKGRPKMWNMQSVFSGYDLADCLFSRADYFRPT